MRPIITTFILLACISIAAHGQLQNNHWCFGLNAGVNFNTSPPTVFSPNINMNEGVSAISNRHTGALLFYASTRDVYDVNYSIMPNGNNIGRDPFGTCAQGVVIVPFVSDTNKYYVFTLDAVNSTGLLSYSVVDMTLNNGLGDVVAGQKMIPIDSGFCESMIITQGCGWYWLITAKRNTQDFYAYNISALGINTTPVISPTTGYTNRPQGLVTMKVSPNREMIGLAAYNGSNNVSYNAVHDFSQTTGVVSNGKLIDTKFGINYYGCEFSPNSRYFYVVGYTEHALYQYDALAGNGAAILATKKTVASPGVVLGQLQIGPDSNIYVACLSTKSLGRVSNADLASPGCVYTANAVQLNGTSICRLGLPQAVVHSYNYNNPNSPYSTRTDILMCVGDQFTFKGRPGMPWYLWQNSSTVDSLVVTQPGTYWVTMPDSCSNFADTFVVSYIKDTFSTRTDTVICVGESLTLKGRPGQASYTWQNGSTQDSFVATTGGVYYVTIPGSCIPFADTFNVSLRADTFSSTTDTLICGDAELVLAPIKQHSNAKYKWNTGATTEKYRTNNEGVYWVLVEEKCAVTQDSFNVTKIELDVFAGNDTVVCDKDSIVLVAWSIPPVSTMSWSNGAQSYTTKVSGAKGKYSFSASYSGCTVTDDVEIFNYQQVSFELGSDTEICSKDIYVLPRLSSIDTAARFLWQDGSNNRKYIVKESGLYTLKVSNYCGEFTDTVKIDVRSCNLFFPSAFSPNGDGRNDIAHFIGDIANVQNFELRIFNRRGQEVYYTNNINDGWDGSFKGQPAAMDVYYYFIKYTYLGEDKLHKGDITLIR